jgi:hypothetical protein
MKCMILYYFKANSFLGIAVWGHSRQSSSSGWVAFSLCCFPIFLSLTQARARSLAKLPLIHELLWTECAPRCTTRCSATAYKKPCLFFCQKCCAKCLCVPPGTYGNKQSCPCYNNWKTKRGGPKCPWKFMFLLDRPLPAAT